MGRRRPAGLALLGIGAVLAASGKEPRRGVAVRFDEPVG
jgi:hypothetical protein